MHCFAVGQRHDAQDARCRLVGELDFAPVAYATVGLQFAAKRGGDHIPAPRQVDVGTFASHLFVKIARRLHVARGSGASGIGGGVRARGRVHPCCGCASGCSPKACGLGSSSLLQQQVDGNVKVADFGSCGCDICVQLHAGQFKQPGRRPYRLVCGRRPSAVRGRTSCCDVPLPRQRKTPARDAHGAPILLTPLGSRQPLLSRCSDQ